MCESCECIEFYSVGHARENNKKIRSQNPFFTLIMECKGILTWYQMLPSQWRKLIMVMINYIYVSQI